MEACAYGIFTRVGEVREIERVRCAHSFDFWYFTNECENPILSGFHAVICLFYTYWDSAILKNISYLLISLNYEHLEYTEKY